MDKKKKWGIILVIIGILLMGTSICIITGAEIQKIEEDTGIVGIIANGSEDISTYAKKVASAIEPLNPSVRTYALNAISHENQGNFSINQVCDVFDTLINNWSYVEDPKGYEYFAKASESVEVMKGDCDDFAILMASCIDAIGGDARVNIAFNSSGGHAYAEVYIANNKAAANTLLDYIRERYNCDDVYYSIKEDKNGNVTYWLNLDWWDKHPGGTYFPSYGNILAIHADGKHYYHQLNIENRNDNSKDDTAGDVVFYYVPMMDPFELFDSMFESMFESMFDDMFSYSY